MSRKLSRTLSFLASAGLALVLWLACRPASLPAQSPATPVLEIKADQVAARVSPKLYGLMTEEINYSYEGGLYGELVRNRTLMEDAKQPAHWSLVQPQEGAGEIALDPANKFNDTLPTSLKLTVAKATAAQKVGVANEGYWGFPVKPSTHYRASLYAKATPGFRGTLTLSLVSNDGKTVYATAPIAHLTAAWQKYQAELVTAAAASVTADTRFVISADAPGSIWFNVVSLFPPTFERRANGNRPDIMQLLADMKPAFLRFPGGNYLEGRVIVNRFDWKKTLGDVSQRPGHFNDSWKYWSDDGLGLLEFLNWCEDLHMEPVLGVFAGFARDGERVNVGADLAPYVQDALDEIEYVTGGPDTAWGARRAKDGHPAPFPLNYVEVGNEDNLDRVGGGTYDGRFAQFYDAIKAKFPKLQLIATVAVKTRTPDVVDEHYYRTSEEQMASTSHMYDKRSRNGPRIFVGEWATRVGIPTPNMSAALGDAAWMTGMERNSDLVIMEAYAPLFTNVNPGGMQWRTNLIGYDALHSYGSPSYYAQRMFSNNHGDLVLPVTEHDIPTQHWQPPTPAPRKSKEGEPPAPAPKTPPAQEVPTLFYSATLNSATHTVVLKVVNRSTGPQAVTIKTSGAAAIAPTAETITLRAATREDTNSITEPHKIMPVAGTQSGISADFTATFPALSITVLKMKLQ